MWKMFDDIIECNECSGLIEPPPKFMIPPPPLPPSMTTYQASASCSDEEMASQAQKAWDTDMCEAIPILDASLYSSQSLQTSAMIAVLSLLLILVVLISSLFVWKNKRKVQNFLPCKTPTRGAHITAALSALAPGHSATYEDPDAHLGHHRPLVMRHHHNAEMLHSKSIHYPSGYPMTRSPPFLVSNSPGPDPYRSNDNVYEELGPIRDSDAESEPPMHSDDDFAEDELSLPGERSFSKAAETNTSNTATIAYQDASAASTSNAAERHSVLSLTSSTHDTSSATAASSSSSSSHNNNSNANNSNTYVSATSSRTGSASILSGMLRQHTGRKTVANGVRTKIDRRTHRPEDTNGSTAVSQVGHLRSMQKLYDNSSNLMALGYQQHAQQHHALNYAQPQSYHHSLHHVHYHNNRITNAHPVPHFYNTIESEVERRNRVNAQLRNPSNAAVATIFHERIQYPRCTRYTQQPCSGNPPNSTLAPSAGERTNPRSIDSRRSRTATPVNQVERAYGYAQPVYHQNYHYESCNAANNMQQILPHPTPAYSAYIMPEYSSGSISSFRQHHQHPQHPAAQPYQHSTSLYAAGDSSFGSDSGYSHHTPASSIGRHEYDIAMPIPPAPPAPTQKPPSKLASALSFSWSKKKLTNATTLTMHPNESKTPAPPTPTTIEASSPNNNSGSSTITSTLENTSSSSSVGLQSQNNNELVES